MAVPCCTCGHEGSHDAFGKGIQITVSWRKRLGHSPGWGIPVVCLDVSLELLNCGRPANTSGIEGKLLLLVAVCCLTALGYNLPRLQFHIYWTFQSNWTSQSKNLLSQEKVIQWWLGGSPGSASYVSHHAIEKWLRDFMPSAWSLADARVHVNCGAVQILPA